MTFAQLSHLQADYPFLVITLTCIFGLLIGSFLNVVVHRLPLMMEHQFRSWALETLGEPPPPPLEMNLMVPRSRCPHCEHMIRAWENIPVFSYVFLRGKCSSCHAPISIRYPVVEILTALLTVIVIQAFGLTLAGFALAGLTWVLITLALIDYDTQYLFDEITLPALWAGLLLNSMGVITTLESALIGAVAGYLPLWAFNQAYRLIRHRDGMGYGDFKLLAVIGAWLGWEVVPLTLIFSSIAGAIIGGALIVAGRDAARPIPFGPYIAIAGFVAIVWGEPLISAYWRYMVPA